MQEPLDQAKRNELRDHISGLESVLESVETAALTRPAGPDREQMSALSLRLRKGADDLRGELEALGQVAPQPSRLARG